MPLENQTNRDETPASPSRNQGVQWPSPALVNQSVAALHMAIADQEKNVPSEFLSSLLECPVCFCYMMPPIMQCPRGHMICQPCRQMVTACPVCRASLTNIRNLGMEKVASKLTFPCKFSYLGCPARLAYAEKKSHEERCECSLYRCPYPDERCQWQGMLTDVYQHLVGSHENVITMEGSDIVFLATNVDLEGALDWTMVQSCHGRHFLLSLEKFNVGDDIQQFVVSCRIIGSLADAAQFVYHISLEGPNRTLSWKSTPKSIREGITYVNSDFLVLNHTTVKQFSKDNDLALNMVIRKVQETV